MQVWFADMKRKTAGEEASWRSVHASFDAVACTAPMVSSAANAVKRAQFMAVQERYVSQMVYFACSLTGGRADERYYRFIVDHLQSLGLEVPTAHLAQQDVMELERVVVPQEVYQRDIEWIDESDALVAEVSTPSHGVGYEIGYALSRGKPVLCCYQHGLPVSKMITGNTNPGLLVKGYRNTDELRMILDGFFSDQLRI